MFDHLLVIGFGGPTQPEEVRPFLERVTRGTRIPEERLREVENHYQQTGGFSPYNIHARKLFDRLTAVLRARGVALPAFLGMRNWHPFLGEALGQIQAKGLTRGLGLVLAPNRCEASFDRYVRSVEQAKEEAGAGRVETEYMGPWHDHPLFIQAQAERVREVWKPPEPGTHLLFTAHSVPAAMAQDSRYAQEIRESASGVAAELKQPEGHWSVAYQSRSGPPGQPWLEPDLRAMLKELRGRGVRKVVVVPIGFLFDHTEVLYDLDIEARQAALEMGLEFVRAPTVMDHPKFVEMLAELIIQRQGAKR